MAVNSASVISTEIEKVRNKKGELVYRTKRFYYSVQLANDLFDIVKDARKRIEGNIELAEEKVKRDRIGIRRDARK